MADSTGDQRIEGVGVDAQGQPVLLGAACGACGTRIFPAAGVCPHCMSEAMAIEAMPRRGRLYSFSIVHTGPRKWPRPMSVGYVDLYNGVRVFAQLRGRPRIDAAVELGIDTVAQGTDGPERGFVFTMLEG